MQASWLVPRTQKEANCFPSLKFLDAEVNWGFPQKTVLGRKKNPNFQISAGNEQSHTGEQTKPQGTGLLGIFVVMKWCSGVTSRPQSPKAIQAERPTVKANGFHLGKQALQRSVGWNSLDALPNSSGGGMRQLCRSPHVT